MMFIVKQITKERIKKSLETNSCEEHLNECIYFFGLVDLFIQKQFNIKRSLIFNESRIQEEIGKDMSEKLISFAKEEVDEYDNLREGIVEGHIKMQ